MEAVKQVRLVVVAALATVMAVLVLSATGVLAAEEDSHSAANDATDIVLTDVDAGILVPFDSDGNHGDSVPTIGFTGVGEKSEFQLFYGYKDQVGVLGGSLNYNFASDFNCADQEYWWSGLGASVMYFSTEVDGDKYKSTDWGPDLGFGYKRDKFGAALHLHYLIDPQTYYLQAMLTYDITKD